VRQVQQRLGRRLECSRHSRAGHPLDERRHRRQGRSSDRHLLGSRCPSFGDQRRVAVRSRRLQNSSRELSRSSRCRLSAGRDRESRHEQTLASRWAARVRHTVSASCQSSTFALVDSRSIVANKRTRRPSFFSNRRIGLFTKANNFRSLLKRWVNMDDERLAVGCGRVHLFDDLGNPAPQIVWIRAGKPMDDDGYRHIYEQHGQNYFELPKISILDAGEYSCIATNMMGAIYSTFNICVEGTRAPTMDESRPTNFRCRFYSHDRTGIDELGNGGTFGECVRCRYERGMSTDIVRVLCCSKSDEQNETRFIIHLANC
jgi:hypothetical protein